MSKSARRPLSSLMAASMIGALLVGAPAGATDHGPCGASADHPGGEWRSYGHDLSNTRDQPLEEEIGPDTVGDVEVAWVFDAGEVGGGQFDSTPIVADGCVYAGNSSGWMFALNADTGELVWATQLEANSEGTGGDLVGAPGVHGDTLIVLVNSYGGPYIAALDRATGTIEWTTVIDETESAISNASVVLYDGMVFAGFSGSSSVPRERGGFALVDADSGELLAKTWTIPDEDYEAGYGGASVWATAAVDETTGYAYVGAGNPHSDEIEHRNANALLKVDLDRDRSTFGEIVAAYKGQSDQYIDGLDRQPVCETYPDIYYAYSFSATCAQLDLDFGASPNLFTDDRGNQLVGALQKSGVYHAAHTSGMQRAWQRPVGAPCFACNAATSAFDGHRLLVAAVPPGQMWGLNKDFGEPEWVAPIGDGIHYQSVSTANGVVYTVSGLGYLNGYDADTGRLVIARRLQNDTGSSMFALQSSAGVSIARNTLYTAASGYLIAYRL